MSDTIQVPDLSEVPSNDLRDIATHLFNSAIGIREQELWPVFQQLHVVIATELRARGEDDDRTVLVLDHSGHEVWTDFEGSAGEGWSVMCDCGFAMNDVPSKDEAEQHGDAHVAATGGRWADWGGSAS